MTPYVVSCFLWWAWTLFLYTIFTACVMIPWARKSPFKWDWSNPEGAQGLWIFFTVSMMLFEPFMITQMILHWGK